MALQVVSMQRSKKSQRTVDVIVVSGRSSTRTLNEIAMRSSSGRARRAAIFSAEIADHLACARISTAIIGDTDFQHFP
jgi:hypothetical protein